MPPRAQTQLVPANTVLNFPAIQNEKWTLQTLHASLRANGHLACLQWLATKKLVKNTMDCEVCACTLNHYAQGIDKYRWRCNQCNFGKSVRNGSFFDKSHIALHKIVQIIYYWSRHASQLWVREEIELGSKHTTVDWYSFIREVCESKQALP